MYGTVEDSIYAALTTKSEDPIVDRSRIRAGRSLMAVIGILCLFVPALFFVKAPEAVYFVVLGVICVIGFIAIYQLQNFIHTREHREPVELN